MRLPKKLGVLILSLLWAATALPRPKWGVAAIDGKCSAKDGDEEIDCVSGAASLSSPQVILQEFLRHHSPDRRNFKIQGWRWHTMSLIREAGRLEQYLKKQGGNNNDKADSLESARTVVDHVVDFNMRGLHKIQDDLFFPWVRQQIRQCAGSEHEDVATAFDTIMDQLEDQRRQLEQMGKSLQVSVSRNKVTSSSQTSGQLVATARSMLDTEDTLLVPLVAHFVPTSSQTSFNNKVIRSLGIWDSRLHLVGMHEAVVGDPDEEKLFAQEIPYLPRMMIPRWKRSLYDPKLAVLEEFEASEQ